jgi:hypothetical protein
MEEEKELEEKEMFAEIDESKGKPNLEINEKDTIIQKAVVKGVSDGLEISQESSDWVKSNWRLIFLVIGAFLLGLAGGYAYVLMKVLG